MDFLTYYEEGMHEEKLHDIVYDKDKNEIVMTIALPLWKIEEIKENFNQKIYGFILKFKNIKHFSTEIELNEVKDYELTLKMKKEKNLYKLSIFLFIENLFPKIVFEGELAEQKICKKVILK